MLGVRGNASLSYQMTMYPGIGGRRMLYEDSSYIELRSSNGSSAWMAADDTRKAKPKTKTKTPPHLTPFGLRGADDGKFFLPSFLCHRSTQQENIQLWRVVAVVELRRGMERNEGV